MKSRSAILQILSKTTLSGLFLATMASSSLWAAMPQWKTVDQFTAGQKLFSFPESMRCTNDGGIYVVGSSQTPGKNGLTWTVRRSIDHGATWQTVDLFELQKGKSSIARSVAFGPKGEVYVSGEANFTDATGTGNLVTRVSHDQGKTWETLAVFPKSAPLSVVVNANTTDRDGRIYTTSTQFDNDAFRDWQIHRSEDGGRSWRTVDRLAFNSLPSTGVQNLELNGVYADPIHGNILAGGVYTDAQKKDHWFVRQSDPSGMRFRTVDDIPDGMANKTFITRRGIYYTAGISRTSDQVRHWVVRVSWDGGRTWKNSDVIPTSSFAWEIGEDRIGDVYVIGSSGRDWLVRRTTDEGLTWEDIDRVPTTGQQADGRGVCGDEAGGVYAVGDANRFAGWSVRKWVNPESARVQQRRPR